MKTFISWSLPGILSLFVLASDLQAAGPLNVFGKLGNSVEADPNKEYVLKETDGPWMILVASFAGPTAKQDANILVFELRKQYKYHAYVFEQTFVHDFKKDVKSRNPYDRKLNYQTKGAVSEYAVFVGNFQSVDDANFQKTLRRIKECIPDCVKSGPNGMPLSPNFVQLRNRISRDENGRIHGPFLLAFASPNPMLPPEVISKRSGLDPFIRKINSDSPYSLLNCPGIYTVRIATFTGRTELKQDRIKDILDGKEKFTSGKNSELELGGRAAARLTAALRAKGYEAYEFHDYTASIVTIGGFNELGYELPNGMTELRPEILDIMNRFRAKPATQGRIQQGTISYEPVVILDIECDTQPEIIEVRR